MIERIRFKKNNHRTLQQLVLTIMFPCNGLDQSCQAHSLSVKVSLPYAWLPPTLLVGLCLFTSLGISRADLVVKHFQCPSLVDQAWSIKMGRY